MKAISKRLIFIGALVCALVLVVCVGCDSADREAVDNFAHDEAVVDNSTNPNGDVHELVYIPLSYLGIQDDLFDEKAVWGVTIADNPDIVVMHIGEGGLLNEKGEKISLDDLKAGDVVRASFSMITMSYPGQVSVESAQLVRAGGEQAIEPYRGVLEIYQEAAIQGDPALLDKVKVE